MVEKKIEKVFELKANYKLIKTPSHILPSIYCELKKISIIENFKKIEELIEKKDKKVILFLTEELKNYKGKFKEFIKIEEKHNIIPLAFRNALAKRIAGVSTSTTFEANYIAIGTDATVVTENDTVLGTELLRGTLTQRSNTGNIAYLDKFFGSSEVGGQNLREIGLFVDGTASVDTGVLLSHVNINEDISSNETLTINISIAINSAT